MHPGWRVTWSIGPKNTIESMASAGSFLDGGGSRPMQNAALGILSAEHARAEAEAIRTTFRRKRNKLIDGLRALGVSIEREPEGTFYVWGNVANLPEGLNTGDDLFRRALEKKVIVVPGHFFDVDPGQRRVGRASRFNQHVRFSFGPSEETIDTAVTRLTELVRG